MSEHPPAPPPIPSAASLIPRHWTPEQALAVFECLQALREALWHAYGAQVQQAWREQLMPDVMTRDDFGLLPQPIRG